MSFDLYVWHEPAPITVAAAEATLEQWPDEAAHPAVAQMLEALLERFPALESLSDDDDLGVWSVTPELSGTLLAVCCMWSRADEVATVVRELAEEFGLVCYEPGHQVLRPNAPGYVPRFTLTSMALPTVDDPDTQRLELAARKLSNDNYFSTLERADGWFVQVLYRAGTYTLEYREGSPDRHFQATTTDLAEVIRFLQEFRAGEQSWKARLGWRPLIL